MRRRLLTILVLSALLIIFLINTLSTLLSLLVEDASADAIHRAELPAPSSTLLKPRPYLIPKIIHQTYINESIPKRWQAAQRSCIELHWDYEYVLWTDAKSREFIEEKYPWFLATFDGYEYPIQRADAIRYFVLATFGGIYIDLDQGCRRKLDPLLSYTAWVRQTVPTGISNDVMGSVPQHPFFLLVTESLEAADRKWVLPYITIMATTGPLFLSVLWKKWIGNHADLNHGDWPGRVRVLMPDLASEQPWSFFQSYGGSSWHGSDAKFIFWMGSYWMLLTAGGFLLAGLLGLVLRWAFNRFLIAGQNRRGNHRAQVRESPVMGGLMVRCSPIWRMFKDEEGEAKPKKTTYELLDLHNA